ncbi:DUF2075 domain-containing protein [Lapidilactobacillus mulanensis]|uniref:DUF2075 domain-containing protein n=1 Tax=Lapidilactobacillus mulanensis TaxID=2485999 RepID=A0ABW4DJK5_9LACO|nr:DUF2075 domain-containing protein [Lapidilactobacillus mulanensis]
MTKTNNVSSPVIKEVSYNKNSIDELLSSLGTNNKKSELLLDYPTVYIIHDEEQSQKYTVYVGETTDIRRRTNQHLLEDPNTREDWNQLSHAKDARMFVIGHPHFNKSLTLDVENQLMMYLLSVDSITQINNRRTNPQNQYYTADEMKPIFSKIWRKLHGYDANLFPLESIIRDSALFKASPFHQLTNEQVLAKQLITDKIELAMSRPEVGQLIMVEGDAGAGKTVLLSNLFYDLNEDLLSQNNFSEASPHAYLLINHEQQLKVYEQIAQKLGLTRLDEKIVTKPTNFINNHTSENPVDIILIDEAHLLWTQGKQSYRGKNQLQDLLKLAKVVIVVFDQHQVLKTVEYLEADQINELERQSKDNGNLIQLKNQMRMDANLNTIDWITDFVFNQAIKTIPHDAKYELKIATNPQSLQNEIQKKAKDTESNKHGLSRVLATFDWKYVNQKKPEDGSDYWYVSDGDWSMPWNLQLPRTRKQNQAERGLSWAEQPETINEVGSTYTIQGFDLNFAGVIIGESVKYRNGHIIFDPAGSKDKTATQKRTLSDGTKARVAEDLLRNQLNVLLTRGVHGLYLYAVDKELQQALLNAANAQHRLE